MIFYLEKFIKSLLSQPALRHLWAYKTTGYNIGFTFIIFIIVGLTFMVHLLVYNAEMLKVRHLRMQHAQMEKNQKIAHKFEQDIQANQEKFNRFQRKRIDVPQQPDALKVYLSKIQKTLKINFLNMSIGSLVNYQDQKKLSQSRVQIEIKTFQDKQFFQLIKKLLNDAPGIVIIKEYELKRVSSLTKEMLEHLMEGKHILFEGKIVLDWIFFDQSARNS